MLTLIDSGCGQHPRWQLTLTGSMATLVGCLINNLPLKGAYPTYICEHGHTHCLLLHSHEDDVTADPPAGGLAEDRVLAANPLGVRGRVQLRSVRLARPGSNAPPTSGMRTLHLSP